MAKILTDSARHQQSFDTMLDNLQPIHEEGWMDVWNSSGTMFESWRPSWEFRARHAVHDPERYLSTLLQPVLWFLGETDVNVDTAASIAVLDKTWANHPDATVVVLPNIDHTFVVRSDGKPARYAPGFWERIKEWLSERGFTGAATDR